jgi:hypothetical protein
MLIIASSSANASVPDSLSSICALLLKGRVALFNICYSLGAISLTGLGIYSYRGNFSWDWFISIGLGLFIVSSTPLIIMYITNGNGSMHYCPTNETVFL